MTNENNKITSLELSITEALILCDALDDFCDYQIIKIISFHDALPLDNNSFSIDDPELLKLIQTLEVVRVASRMLLALASSLPSLLTGNEEIRQRQIDAATSNLRIAEEVITGIENQGVVIEHTY